MNWQASCSPFPWDGSVLLLTKTPRRGAGGAMDVSEVGVHLAKIYYLTKMHLAPHQHNADAGGLRAEGF